MSFYFPAKCMHTHTARTLDEFPNIFVVFPGITNDCSVFSGFYLCISIQCICINISVSVTYKCGLSHLIDKCHAQTVRLLVRILYLFHALWTCVYRAFRFSVFIVKPHKNFPKHLLRMYRCVLCGILPVRRTAFHSRSCYLLNSTVLHSIHTHSHAITDLIAKCTAINKLTMCARMLLLYYCTTLICWKFITTTQPRTHKHDGVSV